MKKQKLLFAALVLIIGAASASGVKVSAGPQHDGGRATLHWTGGRS